VSARLLLRWGIRLNPLEDGTSKAIVGRCAWDTIKIRLEITELSLSLMTTNESPKGLRLKASRVEIDWHPGLPIFSCEPFLKAVSDEYGWLGGFTEGGTLRCALPYTIIRKPGLRMVRFRVETIPFREELCIEEEKSFLNSAVEYFRSARMDIIIPATTNAIFRTFPDAAVVAPYGTYILDLRPSEESLWNNLHRKHRNNVRSAIKNGVAIRTGKEYLNTAYEMIRATFQRSKMGFMGFDAFQRYVLSLEEHVKIMVADCQGTLQGCAVVPFSKHSAHYVYGGTSPNPITGAMNLLHWEAIRHFRALGVQRYDFVGVRIDPEKGSKQEGLKMFKSRFGGRLAQGYIWKCSLRPLKSAAYSVAVRLLKGGDIVDQERHKLAHSNMSAVQNEAHG